MVSWASPAVTHDPPLPLAPPPSSLLPIPGTDQPNFHPFLTLDTGRPLVATLCSTGMGFQQGTLGRGMGKPEPAGWSLWGFRPDWSRQGDLTPTA